MYLQATNTPLFKAAFYLFAFFVPLALLASTAAAQSLDLIQRWIDDGFLTVVDECSSVAWEHDPYSRQNSGNGIACDLEAAGHNVLAATEVPNSPLEAAGKHYFMFVELSSGDSVMIHVTGSRSGEGQKLSVETPTAIQNSKTNEVLVLVQRHYDKPMHFPWWPEYATTTSLDLNYRDANVLWDALLGMVNYDLASISVDLENVGRVAACGNGGECPDIRCRTSPIEPSWSWGSEFLMTKEARRMTCQNLAEYEGEPHGEGAPTAETIRRLLVRALQDLHPETHSAALPLWAGGMPGSSLSIEHTMFGLNFVSINLPPMVVAYRITDVGNLSCEMLSESRAICMFDLSARVATDASIPNSPQLSTFRGMTTGPVGRTMQAEFTRQGDRWAIVPEQRLLEDVFRQ